MSGLTFEQLQSIGMISKLVVVATITALILVLIFLRERYKLTNKELVLLIVLLIVTFIMILPISVKYINTIIFAK